MNIWKNIVLNCAAKKDEPKGHWYVSSMSRDVDVKWIRGLGTIEDPILNERGLPTFVLISSMGRIEMQTLDLPAIEKQAKNYTQPKGRGKHSEDVCRIYIKTKSAGEVLVGKATHSLDREYRHSGPWDDEGEGAGYANFTGKNGSEWAMQDPPNPNSKYYGRRVKNGGQGTGGWVKV